MLFNFEHMSIDTQPGKKVFYPRQWKLTELKAILGGWMTHMQAHDGWDSLYIENHDRPRIVQRWASGAKEHRVHSAKMLAIFHATGRGTLFVYQGQEIGMVNEASWTYDELRDLEEINFYDEEKARRGEGADMSDVLRAIQSHGRDNARTVIPWNDKPHGGFTTGTPWIKVNSDYRECNVAAQEGVEGSVLEFWRRLLGIRKEHPDLVYGWFEMLDPENEQIYAYSRSGEKDTYLVACNFSGDEVVWKSPVPVGELLLGSHEDVKGDEEHLTLRPYEGRLYLKKTA
jgi:oligo-1,6-glucosidase